MARPITFLSDYGCDDEFAGVCRAVIAGIAPGAPLIDLTHGVPRHDVRQGAAVLANALPFAPAGVHLAVVDPGVGSERRAVAVRVAEEDRVLVGPDNGLLARALERFGGAVEAADVSLSPVRLEPLSATFHGRDIFAPVAARLALGDELGELGEPLDPDGLVALPRLEPIVEGDRRVIARVAYVDRFGNAALELGVEEAAEAGLRLGHGVRVGASGTDHDAVYARTFADVEPDGLLLYLDSYGSLTLAVNRGSAVERLALSTGDAVVLSPA